MGIIRDLLALIGLFAILTAVHFYFAYKDDIAAFRQLDPASAQMYAGMTGSNAQE